MNPAAGVFWVSIGSVAYSYAAYPALLFGIGAAQRVVRNSSSAVAAAEQGQPLPRVAVVISAFNEEAHIAARVENLLAQNYPADLLKIYIGSDGSTDGTEAALKSFSDPRLVSFCFAKNRGKANVLNDLMSRVEEPIVVFSDANTQFEPNAIRRVVAPFADARVGCVSGELRLLGSKGDNQDSALWRAEQFLKSAESNLGGALGANGAIYAIRRELFDPLDSDAIIDDFFISMAVAAKGFRIVYRSDAVAIEDTPPSISDEYRRRIRIGIGNYQALFRHPEYLLSTSMATRFTYFSHKVLRWLTPVFLLTAFASNAFLLSKPFYLATFALQAAGYALCFVLYKAGKSIRIPGLLALPVQLVVLNFAFLVALIAFFRGNYKATWKRTER